MSATNTSQVFLPRRGRLVSSVKSQHVVRSTTADTWRWLWPDVLMRILPLGLIPGAYIILFHLPLAFLGLTLGNVPQQLVLGLGVGILTAAFAAVYRMYIVGPWFRWPTTSDHLLQGFFYLFINGPVEELFFRGFLLTVVTQWTGWIGWGWLVSTATYTLYVAQPQPRSLLAVIIVHGLTTCGFLSWGDEFMYRVWKHRQAKQSR